MATFPRTARWIARMGQLTGQVRPLSSGDTYFSLLSGHWLTVERVGPDEVVQITVSEYPRESGATYVVPRTAMMIGQATGVIRHGSDIDETTQPIDV